MLHLDDGSLQAWLDRARSGLTASERDEVEGHLAVCEACRHRLEEMGELSGRVDALLAAPVPADEPIPDFEAVVARARRREPHAQEDPGTRGGWHAAAGRSFRWTAAAWAASVALALGAGWMAHGLYRRPVMTRPVLQAPESAVRQATPRVDSSPSVPVYVPKPVAPRPRTDKPVASAPASEPARRPASTQPTAAASAAPATAKSSDAASVLVRGRVTDDRGKPLPAAQVSVEGTRVGALTAQDGTFALSIDSLPRDSVASDITLNAALIGYGNAKRRVAVHPGGVATADIRLAPQTVSLSEIVVTGATARAQANTAGALREANAPSPRAVTDKATPADTVQLVPPLPVPSDDEGWGSWRVVPPGDETAVAGEVGFHLLKAPDLPVVRIERGSVYGRSLVRVVQALDGGGTLDLVQARHPLSCADAVPTGGRTCEAIRRGEVYIAATAPMLAQELRALLDRLR